MDLYKFYKYAYTITFLIEIFIGFFLIFYILSIVLLVSLNLFSSEIIVLTVLIALGCSCLVTLVGIGLFMRIRDKFVDYLGTEEDFPSETLAEKVVLILWITAIGFFSAAIFYALFLFYQFVIIPTFGQSLFILFICILIGILVLCLILQGILIIMARLTKTVVKEVLDK
ncbi:MAG: hypothetical protein ACFFBP_18355 [Promethearchaeota archaeon]